MLMPGESDIIILTFYKSSMASFDDLGKISKSAYLLEKGFYKIYVGTSVRDVEKLKTEIYISEDTIIEQLHSKVMPTSLSKRLLSDGSYEELPQTPPNDPDENILNKIVIGDEISAIEKESEKKLQNNLSDTPKSLMDVVNNKILIDEFIAQMSNEQLIKLCGGQPNSGVANTGGIGNLPEYGIPNIMTADGPAGLRIRPEIGIQSTAWPCCNNACVYMEYSINRTYRKSKSRGNKRE